MRCHRVILRFTADLTKGLTQPICGKLEPCYRSYHDCTRSSKNH